MIDHSTLGLSSVPTSHHRGKGEKIGTSKEHGKEAKSFDDIIDDVRQKISAKADEDESAIDALDASEGGDENAAGKAAADRSGAASEGRIRLSAGLQQFMKDGAANAALPSGEYEKAEAKGQKTDKKAAQAEKQVGAVESKPAANASEELSILLGLASETSETDGVDAKAAAKSAKAAAAEDEKADPKTAKSEQNAVSALHAAKVDEALQQAGAAHGVEISQDIRQDDEPRASAADGDNVRVVSADGKGRAVDIQIAKTKSDDATNAQSASGKTDFVTVLESRRYLGFSTDSNAGALTSAIKSDSNWAQAIREASISGSVGGTEVNTLKLQMHPEHLGNMTASLRLKGEELSVDVRVETVEAYRQLSNDQDGILRALKDQGFTIDQVTVQLSPSAKSDSNLDSGNQGNNGQNLREGQGDGARQRDDGSRRSGNQDNWIGNDQASSLSDSGSRSDDAGSGNLYL